MKNKIIPYVISALGIFTLFMTVGCETTEGFGRDVEKTGEAIEDAAR